MTCKQRLKSEEKYTDRLTAKPPTFGELCTLEPALRQLAQDALLPLSRCFTMERNHD